MQNETSPTRQMRAILRSALPERAFLRRDRGDALLVSNAPAFTADLPEIPGFTLERRDALVRIFPDKSWAARLEDANPLPPDHLSASLLRFRDEEPDKDNLALFILGLKLTDALPSISETELSCFERMLRQRCALALRGGCAGALYAASILLYQIKNSYKGESKQ